MAQRFLSDIKLGDNIYIRLGDATNGDLHLHHNGTNSYIQNDVGHFYIKNRANDADIIFQSDDGTGGVATYYTIDGGNEANLFSKNVKLSDSVELRIGDSNDLKIYHDGSISKIIEAGSTELQVSSGGSNLYLQAVTGENGIKVIPNSAVELYYNGSKKFETSNAGVVITGNGYLTSGSFLHFDNGGSNDYAIRKQGTTLEFRTGGTYNFLSGNATFAGTITTTSTATGAITLNGGTGVATTGAFVLRQNGDGVGNGIAITSSHATSHRIWKDASGNLNIGPSSDGDAFKQDLSGNVTIAGALTTGGNITAHASGGAGLNLRRDDTTISGTNALGYIGFAGDDPTDGTFNFGSLIRGRANGSWGTSSYPGELEFQTRNTSGSLTTALTLNKDQSATFKGNVDIYTGTGLATLNIGRNSNEKLQIDQTDYETVLTAYNDSDADGDHNFRLNRVFQGSGANNFKIQKGGTDQFTIDTNGTATFAGDVMPSADSTHNIGSNSVRWDNVYADNLYGIVDKLSVTANNTFTGTYNLLWHSGNTVYSSSFMTINGATDTLSVPNISTTGDVTIGGNLTVTGTSTTVNVEDLNVEQGEITLNYAASSDTSSSADGAGIRIQDAVNATTDATILWNATPDRFEFSNSIQVTGGVTTTSNNNFIGGMSSFETTLTNNDDWQNSPISILERGNVNSGQTADKYAPNLNFHWGGTVSRSLWMDASGHLHYGEYSAAGIPSDTDGHFLANEVRASVFKDKDSTGYYLDPAGGSNLAGGITVDGNSMFDDNLRVNGWIKGASDTNTLYSSSSLGTLLQTPGNTAGNNNSKIFFRDNLGNNKHTFDTNNGNATFAGNINFGDSHFIGDDADDNLLIQGSASENVIVRSEDGLYFRTGGNNTRLTINSSGAATFAGGIVANGGISGLTLANGGISGSNYNISGVNQLSIADPGEGIVFGGGSSGNIVLAVTDDSSDNILAVTGGVSEFSVAGNVKHEGLTMTDGTDVDQVKEYSMTFQLSANTWTDTGIDGTDLATGTYVVQMYVDDHNAGGAHWDEYYSGTMSWYSGSTNSTNVDEIILHRAGHASNNSDIQLRTQRALSTDTHDLMLLVKSNYAHSAAMNNTDGRTFRFKFRRLI